jgi:TRAP-type C4-dicarboxylate transport system substrate-binding protein
MKSEKRLPQPVLEILSQQVWETLDPDQQQQVLKTVVSLCQEMIEEQEQEALNEPHSGG